MLSADDQLRRVEARLLGSGGEPKRDPEILFDPGDLTGALSIDLAFPDGFVLSCFVAVDVSYGYPMFPKYGFHLRDGQGRSVFRYDNAPHHSYVETAPDHKHVGPDERVEAHHRPTMADLIEEVWAVVAAATGRQPLRIIGSRVASGEPRPRVAPRDFVAYARLRERYPYLRDALLIRDVMVVAIDQDFGSECRVAVHVDLENRPDVADLGRVLVMEGGGGGAAGWNFSFGEGHRLAVLDAVIDTPVRCELKLLFDSGLHRSALLGIATTGIVHVTGAALPEDPADLVWSRFTRLFCPTYVLRSALEEAAAAEADDSVKAVDFDADP